MAITRVGAASVEATSITLPGSFQNGDLAVIFAFATSLVTPVVPAGWTQVAAFSQGASGYAIGYRLLTSNTDTSGTWTNATGLVCQIYRGVATNKTPIQLVNNSPVNNTSATVTYNPPSGITFFNNSWVLAFAGIKTNASTIEAAPTFMVNNTDTVGAAAEYVGHDTNGSATNAAQAFSTQQNVSVGVSAEYWTFTAQIYAEDKSFGRNTGLRPHPFSPGLAR